MRILEVCRSFPAHRAGGMEWHALDLVEGLEARGHSVSLLTTPLPAAPVLPMPRISGAVHFLGNSPGSYSPDFFLRLRDACSAICRTDSIDVIHAQGFTGARLAGAAELPPVVTTVHGTLYSETALRREAWAGASLGGKVAAAWRFKHRLALDPVWRRFLRSGPRLIVDSQFSLRELERELGAPVAATVVPLGVNLERLAVPDRGAARNSFGFSPEHFVFLLAGRLEAAKRHEFALRIAADAVRENENARVLVVGDGSRRAALEALARELRIADRARFAGVLSSAELAAAYAAADLFVNPDAAAPAFGLANAEALLQGTPVIATDSGAAGEVLRGAKDGVLIPTGSGEAEAWHAAVRSAMEVSGSERDARKAAARKRFSREEMAEKYERALAAFITQP